VPELAELLKDNPPLDRTTVNSWEDIEFVQAVHGCVSFACELQRDWTRLETGPAIIEIVLTDRLMKE
jgi:hypothetical protein